MTRYRVETKWWELVEGPEWIYKWIVTEMIWTLTCGHRACSITTYHDASCPELAQVMAYEFVENYTPSSGPRRRILVGRARPL